MRVLQDGLHEGSQVWDTDSRISLPAKPSSTSGRFGLRRRADLQIRRPLGPETHHSRQYYGIFHIWNCEKVFLGSHTHYSALWNHESLQQRSLSHALKVSNRVRVFFSFREKAGQGKIRQKRAKMRQGWNLLQTFLFLFQHLRKKWCYTFFSQCCVVAY